MNTQKARNTAVGMVRDALQKLVDFAAVQDLRHFENTKEEAGRLLEFAENALSYFEHHYDFPQGETVNAAAVRAVLTSEELSAESMVAEIGELVGEGVTA